LSQKLIYKKYFVPYNIMGGVKGLGAFAKNGEDSAQLLRMFMTKQLSLNAEANDVTSMFPNLEGKTSSQIRSGFNRVRDMVTSALEVLENKENG
jgi:hypothetical protein